MTSKKHPHECCQHDDHCHDHPQMSLPTRWLISLVIIVVALIFLRSFILEQMFVRVTSYASYNSSDEVIRLCKKIIFVDKGNIQAWTSLGYAYLDKKDMNAAMGAFNQVVVLNPQDRGAATFELAKIYFYKDDFAKARFYFESIRSSSVRAGALLDADILKYRHGAASFRSLNSMQNLLGMLMECYEQLGDKLNAQEVKKEYELYKAKGPRKFF